VSLCDISEENDELLDERLVYQYLQMVAPTGFNYGDFPFREKIRAFVQEKKLPELNEYEISLNETKIKKGYKSKIVVPGKKDCVEIKDIQTGLVEDDGKVLGWYWYGITDFAGTMEKFWQSGMRLRKGNIQIGEADCLYQHKMWRERRGNFYFFGEVHALDPDLITNGRRDYFEENVYCRRFERSLKDLFDKMLDVVYAASNIRSALGKVEKTREEIAHLNEKVKAGIFDSTKSCSEAEKKIEELTDQFNVRVTDYNRIKNKWEDKKEDKVIGAAVTSIVGNAKVNTRPVKITSESSTSKPAPLATDALTIPQRKVLDIVKTVLLKKLPTEEFDFIWDEVLEKIKSV
jgi:molecular chaperone HtpG